MVNVGAELSFKLSENDLVEVSSEEEGFRGALYRAEIVEIPVKSSSKKKKQILVRYVSLVTEDGSSLTEYIDSAHIRPLPPEDEAHSSVFEENDIVDALYRDGWWKGIVKKVLQNSRYRVYFDNPSDVIDFERKDLRPHLDWVRGNWIRPKKQPPKASFFNSGEDVELKYDNDLTVGGWVPAIVIKECEGQKFLVKYENGAINNEPESLGRVLVDISFIRPSPPSFNARQYELLEPVDAICDFGWRWGFITKILDNNKYTVAFEADRKIMKDFHQSELRPHMEWVGGKWETKFKVDFIDVAHQKREPTAEDVGNGSKESQKLQCFIDPNANPGKRTRVVRERRKWSSPLKTLQNLDAMPSMKKTKPKPYSGGAGTPLHLNKLNVRRTAASKRTATPDNSTRRMKGSLAKVEEQSKKRASGNIGNVKGKNCSPCVVSQALVLRGQYPPVLNVAEANKNNEHVLVLGIRALGAKEKHATLINTEISGDINQKRMEQVNEIHGSLHDIEEEKKQQKTEESRPKRKRGRPRKFVNSVNSGTDLPSPMGDEAHKTHPRRGRISKEAAALPNNISDHQPLSAWIGANHSTGAEDLRACAVQSFKNEIEARGKQIDVMRESSERSSGMMEKHKNLPFVKKSPVWKSIGSMEAFKSLPQKPHFFPLQEVKEEYREVTAIGMMVIFSALCDKIGMLKPDDPRDCFDNILEGLVDLEKHGFDVTIARGRINELLLIKESIEQLLNQRGQMESDIAMHTEENVKVDEEMTETRRKITELELQLAVRKSQKEGKDAEITTLQARVETLKNHVQNVENEFSRLATAPLKHS